MYSLLNLYSRCIQENKDHAEKKKIACVQNTPTLGSKYKVRVFTYINIQCPFQTCMGGNSQCGTVLPIVGQLAL